jgi:hypothetical protein
MGNRNHNPLHLDSKELGNQLTATVASRNTRLACQIATKEKRKQPVDETPSYPHGFEQYVDDSVAPGSAAEPDGLCRLELLFGDGWGRAVAG